MNPPPLSRRRFVNKAVAGAGLLGLFSALPACSRFGSRERTFGIALVGLGRYAMGELAPALQKTKSAYLAGLVTGTPEKAERYGKEYRIPDSHIYNYETFDTIAKNPDIDAIYVVLPNSMHAEYSIRAAEAGKHVICEKPMAVNVRDCQRMIDACKANGVSLNIGYRLHQDPYNLAIRELAEQQPHGPAKFVHAEKGFILGDATAWRLKRDLAGGGAMMDLGIYCIQAARYSTGEEPVAVTATEYKTDPVRFAEVDETIDWEMEFPSGAVASCNTTYNYKCQRLHVAYAKNHFTAELQPAFSYRGLAGRIGDKTIDFGNPSQQALHMDAIAESVRTGNPTTTPGEEGMQDMRVIEAIYKSIANGGARTEIV